MPPESSAAHPVWVGYTTPAPDSIQRVKPLEVCAFASREAALRWKSELRVTASSPMRHVYPVEVQS